MRPERNDRRISGPVARVARWYGSTVSLAESECRGLSIIRATTSSNSSIRARKNSSLAIGGACAPLPRPTDIRKLLSEKSAKVSSSISRTMVSKSPRVSFRRSGSVTISNRRIDCPGSRNSASTMPAWKPGDQRQRAMPGVRVRRASRGLSSNCKSASAASGAPRSSKR
ncbi:hypothetical protein D9M68_639280 [compost metagenome]